MMLTAWAVLLGLGILAAVVADALDSPTAAVLWDVAVLLAAASMVPAAFLATT